MSGKGTKLFVQLLIDFGGLVKSLWPPAKNAGLVGVDLVRFAAWAVYRLVDVTLIVLGGAITWTLGVLMLAAMAIAWSLFWFKVAFLEGHLWKHLRARNRELQEESPSVATA